MKKILLLIILALSGSLPLLSQRVNSQADAKDAKIPTELSWEAQRDNKRWAGQQIEIDQAKDEAANRLQDVKNAQLEIEALQKRFLVSKKLIPKDPWREIYGEKKYVIALDSGFVKFSGQIHEATQNGIRVFGQKGDSAAVEYFVLNFPYPFKEGESVDPKNYVAFEDGEFSYVTDDGYAKKIPKLNYGKPCAMPGNGEVIEFAAQQLTPQEKAQVTSFEVEAKRKNEIAIGAHKHFQELVEKLRLDKQGALKINQDQAKRGELAGLRRMGERYHDGDSVEKDLVKSAEYYEKAEVAFQEEANLVREETRLKEQEALKQKFIRNLVLADKSENVMSMLYLSNCYSNGIGTGIDLVKAKEFYDKAVGLGLPKLPNRASY